MPSHEAGFTGRACRSGLGTTMAVSEWLWDGGQRFDGRHGDMIFEANGQPYVQLESYAAGHDQDYSRPKQLLQFDAARAAELLAILRRGFPQLF